MITARKPIRPLFLGAMLAVMLSGCAGPFVADPERMHHTARGFRNNHPHPEIGAGFWRWQWLKWRADLPPRPAGGYPVVAHAPPETGFLRDNRTLPTATWINHATVLFQLGGLNVLTDPIWSERASPLPFAGPVRRARPGLALEQLPPIDVVLISHNHYDHLDRSTVHDLAARFGRRLHFLVPLGLKSWFDAEGLPNVRELDWWERIDLDGVEFHFTPVQHWSKRSLFDRDRSLWGGWVMRHGGRRFFFAGDTGYSPDFSEIRGRLGPMDLAALPIGAYLPRWFMAAQHVDPAQAVRIHRDLGARTSIAIHWGTFEMADEALDRPPADLAAASAAAGLFPGDFRVLRHGETLRLPAPSLDPVEAMN